MMVLASRKETAGMMLWLLCSLLSEKCLAPSHTPSIAFRHLPPNSARFVYATEGALFISAQLSTDVVTALRNVWVLIKLQALVYDILPSTTAIVRYVIDPRKLSANEQTTFLPNSKHWFTTSFLGKRCRKTMLGVCFPPTLRASISGTFFQTLPDLVTSLKGHSLSPRSCPVTRSAASETFGY